MILLPCEVVGRRREKLAVKRNQFKTGLWVVSLSDEVAMHQLVLGGFNPDTEAYGCDDQNT
jgi:hypothetical protein